MPSAEWNAELFNSAKDTVFDHKLYVIFMLSCNKCKDSVFMFWIMTWHVVI